MGSRVPTVNDRSRTYWTPTMERYFIDLMLEQMHRGNRIGHTFNKQAWTDMLTVFNAKFASQYDKDVLKSRYTNLWKQFNDVKNLLGQTGFSWDETRKMVIADDYVWNSYLKVHPDARSYKTKAVLNFSDLCIIYGYTTADGRYSRSSHDLDFDDGAQGINMGDAMETVVPSGNQHPRTDWTLDMDQYFIELMLDQIGRGNKVDNTFTKQAWTDMLAFFNGKFGSQHGKRVLRHRYKKLLKYYGDLKVLLDHEGFSWDESRQMIVAENTVWDTYIKAHPNARAYRLKKLPNYNDLVILFGDSISHGPDSNFHVEKELKVDKIQTKHGGKNSHTVASSDRTRTYWTPPMDRYFIDLLLDQVHRGNKLGQTFITQAWINMVTSFNVKFQSCHDKEVLKNRYKHLRRLYNEIKNLLETRGFSWDEMREMVTAEDQIWDTYIKAHPDARAYRVKTVPSYQKLSIIFGQENPDGRYGRLVHHMDYNGEEPISRTGNHGDNDPFRIDWKPAMDRYFVDLLLEQMHGGNKIDDTIDEQALNSMVNSFNEEFGVLCDKHTLEARYVSLMKDCDSISAILGQNGFSWDATREMIIADDGTWEAYLKKRPEIVTFRNKILDNYVDLCRVRGNEVLCKGLGGQFMLTSENFLELSMDVDDLTGDIDFSMDDDVQVGDEQRKRPVRESSIPKQSNKVQKMDPGSTERSDFEMAVEDGAVVLVHNEESQANEAIGRAVNALQALPDMDDELLLDACDLLEDERKAKTFLALDIALRKKWLLRKLRT